MRSSPPARPLDAELLATWPLPLDGTDDKYERGTVLVIGGSRRTPGAALLTGLAALRTGAGRLQIATVAEHATALALAVPEAAVEPLPATPEGAIEPGAALDALDPWLRAADAVAIGPGLADPDAIADLLAAVLVDGTTDAIVVVDALALVPLRATLDGLPGARRARVLVSPNRGEAHHLLGRRADDLGTGASSVELAAALAGELGVVACVHGAVASPDGSCWVSDAGGPGLGTSGSGDVLAGLLAGAAARSGDPARAACWGTFLHATAGDRLAARVGTVGYLARELVDEVPGLLDPDRAPAGVTSARSG